MKKRMTRIHRMTSSASKKQAETALKVAVVWGLLGCSAIACADDEAIPDMEFLEYLGSWEESDEDWVLLTETDVEQVASEKKRTDPAQVFARHPRHRHLRRHRYHQYQPRHPRHRHLRRPRHPSRSRKTSSRKRIATK